MLSDGIYPRAVPGLAPVDRPCFSSAAMRRKRRIRSPRTPVERNRERRRSTSTKPGMAPTSCPAAGPGPPPGSPELLWPHPSGPPQIGGRSDRKISVWYCTSRCLRRYSSLGLRDIRWRWRYPRLMMLFPNAFQVPQLLPQAIQFAYSTGSHRDFDPWKRYVARPAGLHER